MYSQALSRLQAFLDSDETELVLNSGAFEGSHLRLAPAMQSNALPINASLHGVAKQLYEHNTFQYALKLTLITHLEDLHPVLRLIDSMKCQLTDSRVSKAELSRAKGPFI